MALQFGTTWWGKQWLNALLNIDFSNRLPRGKTYARNGSVKEFICANAKVTGKVQGSHPKPYKVKLSIERFSAFEQETILDIINDNPAFLARLLSRELPPDLKDALERKKIRVFPRSWRDMEASCSCPDYAVPCKHIAAIIYLIANEIDKNPFFVFELHGMDLPAALEKAGFSGAKTATVHVPSIQQLTESLVKEPTNPHGQVEILTYLDFSRIPECRTELLSLLSASPLFYPEGNFKKVLENHLKIISKQAKTALEATEEEPETTAVWEVYPESIKQVALVLDDELTGREVRWETVTDSVSWDFRKRDPVDRLLDWLSKLPLNRLPQYAPSVHALAALRKLALVLLKQGAVIPQILDAGDDEYRIRWLPAALNENVQTILQSITEALPDNLLEVAVSKKSVHFFSAERQAAELLSLFLTRMVAHWNGLDRYADEMSKVFFTGQILSTHQKVHQDTPSLIHLWIKRFYLSERKIVPIVQIEEGRYDDFLVNLLLAYRSKSLQEPIPLRDLFEKPEYADVRLPVLQDLSVLTEYFPALNGIIASKGKEPLTLEGADFAPVLLNMLPLIRLLGIRVLLPKSLQKLVRPQLSLLLDSEDKGVEKHFLNMDELLRYQWQVALGNAHVSPEEFGKLVKGLSGLVKIRDQYVLIDPKEMQELLEKLEKPPVLKATDLLQAALTEEYAGAGIRLSPKVQALLRDLLDIQTVSLPANLRATLRPYQLRGFSWLYKNSRIGFGSIIADDMGLGKTLQVITTLLKFKEEGYLNKKCTLVVVPTTLLTNWQKEVNRFAPGLQLHVYHGPSRKLPATGTDVLLTTYGVARSDADKLAKLKWYAMVIDEAQNIKNPGTAQTKALKKIKADVHIAMSGTPVENRLAEYWSLMDFANKGYLGSLKYFRSTYAYPIEVEQDQGQLKHFRQVTTPFILRRVKSDKMIISDLPDKVTKDEYCSLTKEQAALYQNMVDEIMRQVETRKGIERSGLIFKLIRALKQVCNHPAQFLKQPATEPDLSGKAQRLMELLDEIYQNNEKVLIFTQFQQMGALLQQFIAARHHTEALFLHGGSSRKQRDGMVEAFQQEPVVKTMILSLKAGGTGLNLTAASRVIHYDLWWNPAVEAQATDRAYRIGQQRNVFVHRLLTQGTFEEKINALLTEKRDLANLTVTQGEQWVGELSNKELKQIFKLEKE